MILINQLLVTAFWVEKKINKIKKPFGKMSSGAVFWV